MPSPQEEHPEDLEIYEMDDPNTPDYMKELAELSSDMSQTQGVTK